MSEAHEELGYGRKKTTLRRFPIPSGEPVKQCRSCAAEIIWTRTANAKPMPLNLDGTSHFDTCPNAKQHRKVEVPKLSEKQRRILNAVKANEPMKIRTDNRIAWHECRRDGLIELAPNNARWLLTELGQAALEKL